MKQSLSNRRPDYLFIFLLILVLVAILAALAIIAAEFAISTLNLPLLSYLPINALPSSRQILTGIGVLILVAFFFALLARWRIKSNRAYQFINGCPNCHKHELVRVHRQFFHRFLAKTLRIPLRNYACRNCEWKGTLLYIHRSQSTEPKPQGESVERFAAKVAADTQIEEVLLEPVVDPDQFIPDVMSPEAAVAHSVVNEAVKAVEEEPAHLELEELPDSAIETPAVDEIVVEAQPKIVAVPAAVDEKPETQIPADEQLLDMEAVEERNTKSEAELGDTISDNAEVMDEQETLVEETETLESHPREMVLAAEIDAVSESDPELPSASSEEITTRAIVIAPFGISLRSAPNVNAEVIRTLETDCIVDVFSDENADTTVMWRKVSYEGQVGWASAAFLKHLLA